MVLPITDPIVILLSFVIVSLTIILLIIGWQIVQILKEFKLTVGKMNKILDDSGRITSAVAAPVEQASEFLLGLRKGLNVINAVADVFKEIKIFKKPFFQHQEALPSEKPTPVNKDQEALAKPAFIKSTAKPKRFFTKAGKTLVKT